ncbi:transcriptional regulator FtrA [Zavarzinia compransoris]|uniref:Transcriptional regulator FtrA n=1 Tax=Zavarzinia compransoris TaxID=1264899 RepID=A0A317DXK8_9PROT|nr:transcriptional regulator FtrA [Zavarzinia compransoris]PWR19231.1 transcriptional regulator FtrA [Zavarzinia compransoris]TDP49145.1 AraC family transcriptional regulator with amidase-like domain [Zavarzinia compransoris]
MPEHDAPDPSADRLVVVLAYDGLCTFEFGLAVEIFGLHRPEMGAGWYRFAVAGIEPGPLRATGGIALLVDGGLDLIARAGTVVVPGWRGADVPVPADLIAALRAAAARGARLLSICSGVFVLAAAGLLDGRRATTHWRHAARLAERYPAVTVDPDVLYVDEGQVLTSAGSAAGLDLCLHLVRRDFGPEAANRVARRLVLPAHRDGGQAQFIERPVPRLPAEARLGPLIDRVLASLDRPHAVGDLAAQAGMSLRSFIRRFKAATGMAPGEWLLEQRLSRARDLLEQGGAGVEQVASACGFGAAASLRHHFRRRFGVAPATYRARFAAPVAVPARNS